MQRVRRMMRERRGFRQQPGRYHPRMAVNPANPQATARLEIEYCTQCGFLPRAAWLAQELLATFALGVREVALVPGRGGVFEVRLDGEKLFNLRESEEFVDPRKVKQAIRDRLAPGRSLGHTDRHSS